MAISTAMASSFKRQLLEGIHNFLNSGGDTFKAALQQKFISARA